MELSEINFFLTNKQYVIRSEFMREYHFNDEYLDYYKKFILENVNSTNRMFLTDLIYLASKINFNTSAIQSIFKNLILNDSRFLVKLAILDYWVELEPKYLPKDYEEILLILLKNKNYKIVRNQVYFNLFLLNNSSMNFYFERLIEGLRNTTDWKSIYRTLANFKYVSSSHFLNYKNKVIKLIKELHREKNFGDGINEILLSIKKRK